MEKNAAIELKERVHAAQERFCGEGEGLRDLERRLRAALRLLRSRHDALHERDALLGWEQWLWDNFYALEAHGKQTLADLRGLRRRSSALLRLYRMLEAAFSGGEFPLSQENVRAALEAAGDFTPLDERQFAFLWTALKAVLLATAARACGDDCPEEARENRLAYAVSGLDAVCELDFDALIRACSGVEAILAEDPAGVYPKMVEESRRHYRQVVARLAKRTGASEPDVAREVLACAQTAAGERERHVGFYLLNHDPLRAKAKRRGIAALTLSWVLPLVLCMLLWPVCGGIAALLSYLPLVEIVRIFSGEWALRGVPACHIPRIELGEAAPGTVVVVSTLLPAAARAEELRVRLEQLCFSNSGNNLYFCVLADFKEDRRPYNPQDEADIAASQKVIERLNAQYGARFFLFVRRRVYSRTQNAYSGWERKRGAITEFVRFLKGGETSVCCFVGEGAVLAGLRYLIALDADTGLAFETANLLVSAAEHLLNRPVIGEQNTVVAGYGILVPRIGVELESAKATDFTRVMAGAGGVPTYERECCDFYQDLFGTALFSGKGLIDIDAFHRVLGCRFPENTVLSHDILEGGYLRAGLLSDVEMSDGVPSNAPSWFARMHRWIRGDWQNLPFLGKAAARLGATRPNALSPLSRYQLFDNLRRSLVPVAALGCVLAAPFLSPVAALLLCGLAALSVSAGPLTAAVRVLAGDGRFALARRFFTRTLPRVFELLGQALLAMVMTAQQALVTLDAIGRTLWRMLRSRKNLLQWTTAAQSEQRQMGFFVLLRHCWPAELIGLLLLIFAPSAYLPVKLYGFLFLLYLPMAVATARPSTQPKLLPDRVQRERLLTWCARMFRYYEDYVNAENHFLPPDNVQASPTVAVARRTSPTNIGMYLLSLLAARDFHFIDSAGLYLRLSRTLDTVESLKTYAGNLYNWYATDDLRVLPNEFVSAVDSGNYLCALVALREGLREYAAREPGLLEEISRIDRILKETDFSIFYNPTRKLLTIGIGQDGKKVPAHYDFLMSEARTAAYYAIATRQAGRKHWRALSRTISRSGVYAGPVSWTGTMFEYFMPHLLLPAYEGSLLGEALHYALYCQKRRAHRAGLPWGISESGYYAFDEHLNYQYKAHGVQTLGVKQGLDRECVIAPYATFLTLPFDLDGGMRNLDRLEALGLVGQYGFYEAVDFTPGRAGEEGAIVRSYMAHHVGMSLVACANALNDNVMQKRFMRDHAMRSAREFLQEKISKDTVVYDQMKPETTENPAPRPMQTSLTAPVNPLAPVCGLLSNGELTHVFADNGGSWLRLGDCDLTRRSNDPLLHGQGIFCVARMCGEVLSATAAPFWQPAVHGCVLEPDAVVYTAQKGPLELCQRFTVERGLPVERCALTVCNHSDIKAVAELLFYFEPVLAQESDYAAHPAFSKLFLLGERDKPTGTVRFSRRHRDGSPGVHLAVGFDREAEYECCLRRERMTPYPEGMQTLLRFFALPFGESEATPDGCCALRLSVVVPARGSRTVTLLLSAAATQEECAGNLAIARSRPPVPARAPLMEDTLPGRLSIAMLPRLLLGAGLGTEELTALGENTRGQDALWALGLSGDRPIVLYDWAKNPDAACLDGYVQLWAQLRLLRLEFDFCVLGAPGKALPEGVRLLNPSLPPDQRTALQAAACWIAGEGEASPPPGWEPLTALQSRAAEIPLSEERLDLVGGAYVNGRFYVERVTPLPFSHVLSTPAFGCLPGDAALGNTWWKNARECKLTPWNNDIACGNDGERVLLRTGGLVYDLVNGARASFSPEEARYEGCAGELAFSLAVTVAGSAKFLDLTLENRGEEEAEGEVAYYLEPVLGVSRRTAKYVQFGQRDGCLTMTNPYTTAFHCHAAVHVPGEFPGYTVDRAAFWAGDWSARQLLPNHDPIAGTVLKKRLPPRRREQVRFILAAAASEEEAVALALAPPEAAPTPARTVCISTPSEPLNCLFNGLLPHQIKAGRLWGRCGFYQCSGAYGFRDQLQDAGALASLDPSLTREQILRCCAVQFSEGDVLHWWHDLPGGIKGVRTRFSDDLLWLPLTVCDYLAATGETSLLDVEIAYCEGELLAEGEQERYLEVHPAHRTGSVYDHCIRAIDRAHNLGDRGIPKIGSGDWNDGFSAVGAGGRGQSVWLGMFLALVCDRFAPQCERCADRFRGEVYRGWAAQLRAAVDKNCWDGQWYLRAFYDDGAPLGGAACDACKIDLLPQSFAVFCGMPDRERVRAALDAALEKLVDREGQLVRLFAPPFRESARNPGYIKAYPAGIRENGGQYTHGAIWLAMALLEAGRAQEGWELLDLLNPAARCTDAALAKAYKLEPYYLAADLYTHPDAYGHGGWSLYTGAAGWYYRAVSESLLGLRFGAGRLELCPRLPESWNRFSVTVTDGGATIALEARRTGVRQLTVDGSPADFIPLDGTSHRALLTY